MIKDIEMECKTKFSTDVEFSFSFKEKTKPVAIRLTEPLKYSTICVDWYAAVAQSVEHFIGNEEVRQFKSAQQLH